MSLQQANHHLVAIAERRAERFPQDRERSLHARPLVDWYVGDYRERLFVLFGAVLCVPPKACRWNCTPEIGIRVALGASRRDVVRLVIRQAAPPVLTGVALGALAATFASRMLAAQLVNVQTTDPLTFATVAAGLTFVALLAALIPARRAAGLDPTRALQAG